MAEVPMAKGDPFPAWPLPGLNPWINGARTFGAPRAPIAPDTRARLHPGVDLVVPIGTEVVATEDGYVVKRQGWRGPRTEALVVQGDSGLVQVYGALLPGTTPSIGARVYKGQRIGEVGEYPRKPNQEKGASMLHFETWGEGTEVHERWYADEPPPPNLLDPREYLAAMSEAVVFDDDEPVAPLPHDEPLEPEPSEPVMPEPEPVTPEPVEPEPEPASSDGGAALLVLMLAVLFAAFVSEDFA